MFQRLSHFHPVMPILLGTASGSTIQQVKELENFLYLVVEQQNDKYPTCY